MGHLGILQLQIFSFFFTLAQAAAARAARACIFGFGILPGSDSVSVDWLLLLPGRCLGCLPMDAQAVLALLPPQTDERNVIRANEKRKNRGHVKRKLLREHAPSPTRRYVCKSTGGS